jgi:hypothetical protein
MLGLVSSNDPHYQNGPGYDLEACPGLFKVRRLRPAGEDHCRILTTKTGSGMTQKLAWARLRLAQFRPARLHICPCPDCRLFSSSQAVHCV